MIRRALSGLGRTMIAAGLLILLFAAYQLWGTNLAASSAQKTLARQFATHTRLRSTGGAAPEPLPGAALAHLTIPAIGLDRYVVQGVGEEDLQKGPGHYPGTPLPGEVGNVAIAGHRTTYGAPFYNLNELQPGDPIYLTTTQGTFRYLVSGSQVVNPGDVGVIANTPDARLTLTTCNPRFSAATRLIVSAGLVGAPMTAPTRTMDDVADGGSLTSGSGAAIGPSIAWGLGAAALSALAWAVSRHSRRRLPAYAVAAIPFLVLLFFFFQSVSQVLPASI